MFFFSRRPGHSWCTFPCKQMRGWVLVCIPGTGVRGTPGSDCTRHRSPSRRVLLGPPPPPKAPSPWPDWPSWNSIIDLQASVIFGLKIEPYFSYAVLIGFSDDCSTLTCFYYVPHGLSIDPNSWVINLNLINICFGKPRGFVKPNLSCTIHFLSSYLVFLNKGINGKLCVRLWPKIVERFYYFKRFHFFVVGRLSELRALLLLSPLQYKSRDPY